MNDNTELEEENKSQKDQCSRIIDITTKNLSNETLKHLLITVQRVNTRLCAKYAIESLYDLSILKLHISDWILLV